jgi:hypothetical protein
MITFWLIAHDHLNMWLAEFGTGSRWTTDEGSAMRFRDARSAEITAHAFGNGRAVAVTA